MTVSDLTKVLEDAGASYEVLSHDHTERAIAEAQALGVPVEEVAKTVIVTTRDGHVRALVPASRRVDVRKLRELLDVSKHDMRLTTEEEMARDYPEFELGAVPPLGGASEPVVVDSALASRESIVFEAGSHDDSVRVRTNDLLRIAGARVADISLEE